MKKSNLWALFALSVVALVSWGIASGRLVLSGNFLTRDTWKAPPAGAALEVHPEVLNLQASFSRVAASVKPSVVSVSTYKTEITVPSAHFFFRDAPEVSPRQRSEGMGSGVLIDPDGLVLTNEHVLRDAEEIKVLVYDKAGEKKEFKAQVVGKDAKTDLAVLRIRAGEKLPFATLGDSDKIEIGDWAIAIGSPFGLSQTLTVGVISAARQSLVIEDREYRHMIQTDAAINRGNSGGPLLNIRGEVIGINTAIFGPTGVFAGIGFAVPINQAKAILQDLIQKGKVVRGWLGVELGRDLTPAMVKVFGLPDRHGALVNEVVKNGPAEKAGLKRGDVIVSFNGKPVKSAAELQTLVADTPPNRSVPLEIIRQKEKRTLTLGVEERPESVDLNPRESKGKDGRKKDSSRPRTWQGIGVIPYSADLAAQFRQPRDAEGVLVTHVEPGSWGERVAVLPGDIIRGVNQTPTPTVETFLTAAKAASLEEGLVLDVLRQSRAIYLSYSKK